MALMVAFGVWKVIEAGGVAVAMFLNGAHVVKLQLCCAVPTALLAIALKLVLVPQLGAAGAVWATVAAYLLLTVVPYLIFLPRILAAARNAGKVG